MPGYYGGAGDFTLDAREIVKRVPGPAGVGGRPPLAGARGHRRASPTRSPGASASSRPSTTTSAGSPNPAIQPHFQPLDPAQFAFAKQWGLSLALQDVRRVVLSARRQGKRVILGGHSLGASMTVAYASWDFDGHAGLQGPRRPRAHRRRAARVVLDARPRGDEEGDQGARHERPVRRPPRARAAVGGRRVRARPARIAALKEPTAPVDRAVLPAAAGAVQAADPGHQPRPARLRVRRLDLAQGARAHPRPGRHARAPTATGSTAR